MITDLDRNSLTAKASTIILLAGLSVLSAATAFGRYSSERASV